MAKKGKNSRKSGGVSVWLTYKWLFWALVVLVVVMLGAWRPWTARASDQSRTISVAGEATLKASPDEFTFQPLYEFKDADKTVALAQLTNKQTQVVAGLEKLGVATHSIKVVATGYDANYFYDDTDTTYHYPLNLTVTVDGKDLAKKVQDYLITTSPVGSISPSADFSEATRNKLETQARAVAAKDARGKADQMARNLGAAVGKIKSVEEEEFGGGVEGCDDGLTCPKIAPTAADGGTATGSDAEIQALDILSGQNGISYTMTVVYYLK